MAAWSPHSIRVQRLYRKSLKNLLDWCVHRDLWIQEAFKLQARFQANKGVTDPRKIERLVSEGEAELKSAPRAPRSRPALCVGDRSPCPPPSPLARCAGFMHPDPYKSAPPPRSAPPLAWPRPRGRRRGAAPRPPTRSASAHFAPPRVLVVQGPSRLAAPSTCAT